MSSVLPFDIIALIIDTVGENEDTTLLKELALVSHSFLQTCTKYLFAIVELHDAIPNYHVASSKKGFVKLLQNRPDVVQYIRKLTYKVDPSFDNDDRLSPILPNFLRTISSLNRLTITSSKLSNWDTLNSSLTSAFLHLMHLPTTKHIDLSYIRNFPLNCLTPSVNLHRLDIFHMRCFLPHELLEEDGPIYTAVQLEMTPKIREFHTSESALLTSMLLHVKRQDGRQAFDFMDLRRLSISSAWHGDGSEDQNIQFLLQNAKLLEKLHLSVELGWSLVGLRDILSPSARTLKVLDLKISLDGDSVRRLCEELEAMAGRNILEVLSFEFQIDGHETEDFIGSTIQNVEKVLIKPGWSALRQVSLKISFAYSLISKEVVAKLSQALQSLPDKYLNHLTKLESVTFNYSTRINDAECYYKFEFD